MTPELQFRSSFFRSLRKLYFCSQLCGFASFSYSPKIGVNIKTINVVTSIFFTVLYWILIVGNATAQIDVIAKGYKVILFYIGLRFFAYYTLSFMWLAVQLMFLVRKRICELMENLVELESNVSKSNLVF